MSDRKLIVVVGLPSGGTSIVAGILHHLGVNMGNIPQKIEDMDEKAQHRRYLSYECQDLTRRWLDIGGTIENPTSIMGLYYMFKDYVNERLAEPGIHGVKYGGLGVLSFACNPKNPMRKNVLSELPIQVVGVTRRLEDVFFSEWQYNGFGMNQATAVGHSYYHLTRFGSIVKPVHYTTFEWCLDNTREEVDKLIRALMLKPTKEQYNAACDFVNSKTKGKIKELAA